MNDIPAKIEECLLNKSLCMLLSMGPKNRPKTRSKLENALGPCTAVVPYANPLDVLAAANKSSAQPAPSVNIPHAKKRVYVEVKKLKEEFDKLMRGIPNVVAPHGSDPDKSIVDDVIAWLHSEPEGIKETLINEVLQRCKKLVCIESPNVVLKHLKKTENVKVDDSGNVTYNFPTCGKTLADYIRYFRDSKDRCSISSELDASSGQITPESSALSHTSALVLHHLHELCSEARPSTESELLRIMVPVCKTFFTVPPSRLLGMNTGLVKHRQIKPKSEEKDSKTKKNLQSVEQKISETEIESNKKKAELSKKPKMKMKFAIGVLPGENGVQEQIPITPQGLTGVKVSIKDSSAQQPRAVSDKILNKKERVISQCKELTAYRQSRLTVAARSNGAILMPANEEEKRVMIAKVADWVGSYQSKCPGMTKTEIALTKLQKELINICVGKVRQLAPSTITDMLQKANNITVDDKQSVTYHLPASRDKISSWQQDTIQTAINASNTLKEAFRMNKMDRKKEKTAVKKRKVNPKPPSSPESESNSSSFFYEPDSDLFLDDGDDIDSYDHDAYDCDDDYGCGDDYDDDLY